MNRHDSLVVGQSLVSGRIAMGQRLSSDDSASLAADAGTLNPGTLDVGTSNAIASDALAPEAGLAWKNPLLNAAIVCVLVLWLLAVTTSRTMFGPIHLLLVLAVILMLLRVALGRKASTKGRRR